MLTIFRPRRRREKRFGDGCARPLDRNAKARVMARARALSRPTVAGRAYGAVTAKGLAVLGALLYRFHNGASGRCFPALAAIAEAADCAISTVKRALADLEAAGILTWVNRLLRQRRPDGFGGVAIQVVRTSNAYAFCDPGAGKSCEADLRPGTPTPVYSSRAPAPKSAPARAPEPDLGALDPGLAAALANWEAAKAAGTLKWPSPRR